MNSRTALPTDPLRAPERALPASTRLDEFEIETVLAQSSFSIVYRAYDHGLKLHVAIKEYLPDALALRSAETQLVLRARTHADRFEQGLQAFIGEAQTLARCEHPSLQRISRLLLRHGTAYRVMRYSPGPTLLAHRRVLGATPPAATLRVWLDALLGALETLHDEGCVHGAVAPGNILLLPGDRPLLLDFNAVRAALISDRTQSMMAALEPCYEPVEQREPTADTLSGPWTDLYSLAATLHLCISGDLPPPPDGGGRPFEPLVDVWPRCRLAQPGLGDAPPWLAAIDACLQENPADRPQSVAQLRARLGGSAPAAAPPAPGPTATAAPPVLPLSSVWPDPMVLPRPTARPEPAGQAPAAPSPGATTPPRPAQPPSSAAPAAGATSGPGAPPPPSDPAHAKVLADLDKTFAFIAAQATEEADPNAAAPPVATEGPPASPAAPAPGAAPAPLTQRQLTMAGGAVLGMLLALGAVAVWLFQETQPSLLGTAPTAAEQSAVAQPAAANLPTDDATTKALEAAAAALAKAPPRAGPDTQDPPAPPPAQVPPAKEPAKPAPSKPKVSSAPGSPREACGERTRFALFQCMQTQCAKRAWTKHAQCVQFRKDQKL